MSTARRWGLTAAMLAGAALTLASSAQAATYPAWAGAPAKVAVAQLEFDHFFNPALTVHVGDTVKWTINGFHTVSFPAKGTQPPALDHAGVRHGERRQGRRRKSAVVQRQGSEPDPRSGWAPSRSAATW